MTKTEIIDFSQYVEESNQKFLAANSAKKRVMIARDTIARIKANLIVPNRGNFMHTHGFRPEDSLQEIANTKRCIVCAKGALLCSFVGRVNKFTIDDVEDTTNSDGKGHEKLQELFSRQQLDLIETAFEGKSYMFEAFPSERIDAEKFYREWDDNDERLIAICRNIIKNKGTFKP